MTLTACERAEWRRYSDTLAAGSALRRRYDAALSSESTPLAEFDALASAYRAWLVFNAPTPGFGDADDTDRVSAPYSDFAT